MKRVTEQQYSALLEKARHTNDERDGAERESGFAPPGQGSLSVYLRTADSAIEAGLLCGDLDCIAEGLVMLKEAIARLHADPSTEFARELSMIAARDQPVSRPSKTVVGRDGFSRRVPREDM